MEARFLCDPDKLRFVGHSHVELSAELTLQNIPVKNFERNITFKIVSSDPNVFTVTPDKGIISSGSTVTVKVDRKPFYNVKEYMKYAFAGPYLTIWYRVLEEGFPGQDDDIDPETIEYHWLSPPYMMGNHKVKIIFQPPPDSMRLPTLKTYDSDGTNWSMRGQVITLLEEDRPSESEVPRSTAGVPSRRGIICRSLIAVILMLVIIVALVMVIYNKEYMLDGVCYLLITALKMLMIIE